MRLIFNLTIVVWKAGCVKITRGSTLSVDVVDEELAKMAVAESLTDLSEVVKEDDVARDDDDDVIDEDDEAVIVTSALPSRHKNRWVYHEALSCFVLLVTIILSWELCHQFLYWWNKVSTLGTTLELPAPPGRPKTPRRLQNAFCPPSRCQQLQRLLMTSEVSSPPRQPPSTNLPDTRPHPRPTSRLSPNRQRQ